MIITPFGSILGGVGLGIAHGYFVINHLVKQNKVTACLGAVLLGTTTTIIGEYFNQHIYISGGSLGGMFLYIVYKYSDQITRDVSRFLRTEKVKL